MEMCRVSAPHLYLVRNPNTKLAFQLGSVYPCSACRIFYTFLSQVELFEIIAYRYRSPKNVFTLKNKKQKCKTKVFFFFFSFSQRLRWLYLLKSLGITFFITAKAAAAIAVPAFYRPWRFQRATQSLFNTRNETQQLTCISIYYLFYII